MNGLCTHCGHRIDSPWSFCPSCGAKVPPPEPASESPEHVPDKQVYTGMFFGFVAVPLLLVTGSLLCLTGLGAFLGVPMIIVGVLAPLLGLVFGITGHLETDKNKRPKAA